MAEEKSMTEQYEWSEDMKDFNRELEERILAANEDSTKVKWNKLLPDLMTAEVLIVGQFAEGGVQTDRTMNILMLQKDGHTVIPFFSSPERMKVLVKPEQNSFEVMKVNTVRFFQSIKGKPCVLDPMSPYARVFTPFEMKVLAAENEDRVPPLPDADAV
ncbi:MAG: SseB family protein [Lachnospiraceae bacterium]|nr:SseB family protein [Ruminococcus sp.]MCM1276373.1 SseB family protein [Lachnospiraceae bacterium]